MTDQFAVSDILSEFRFFDGNYKKEHVDGAIELKDEIIPYLIKILENLLSNPLEYTQDEHLYDHIYAVMLLGHFKAKDSHQVIVDVFSLKDGIPDTLFGDLITEDLPMILINTCDRLLDPIKSMILDKEVDEYCRSSACRALAYAVTEEYISRKEVVEFLGELFTGNEADEISDFWGLVAATLSRLYPEEIMDDIRAAYESGLISPGIIGYESFERSLELGEEQCLKNLRGNFEYRNIDDIHRSMSWWSCFKNSSKKSYALNAEQNQAQKKSQRKKAAAKKNKRKLAKKSRKKNRR